MAAEDDLLDTAVRPYRLRDTGQGLNRVQPAPRCQQAMSQVLHECRSHCGGDWVGSTVVHLGDHNVPNALFFLVKYAAVPAILVRERRRGRGLIGYSGVGSESDLFEKFPKIRTVSKVSYWDREREDRLGGGAGAGGEGE